MFAGESCTDVQPTSRTLANNESFFGFIISAIPSYHVQIKNDIITIPSIHIPIYHIEGICIKVNVVTHNDDQTFALTSQKMIYLTKKIKKISVSIVFL